MSEPRPRPEAESTAPEPSLGTAGAPPPRSPAERPEPPGDGRIVRTATEARQGEIILGKYGRWIWIGAFAVIALLAFIFGL